MIVNRLVLEMELKDSSDPSHFIFEISIGKAWMVNFIVGGDLYYLRNFLLRVVQTQAILFSKLVSKKVGSD